MLLQAPSGVALYLQHMVCLRCNASNTPLWSEIMSACKHHIATSASQTVIGTGHTPAYKRCQWHRLPSCVETIVLNKDQLAAHLVLHQILESILFCRIWGHYPRLMNSSERTYQTASCCHQVEPQKAAVLPTQERPAPLPQSVWM